MLVEPSLCNQRTCKHVAADLSLLRLSNHHIRFERMKTINRQGSEADTQWVSEIEYQAFE